MAEQIQSTTRPAWFSRVRELLTTGQSEIFALCGHVNSYPVAPQENLVDYLRREDVVDPLATDDSIHLFATLSPALGLRIDNENHQAAWERVVPPAEDNPFASAAPSGLPAALAQVAQYLASPEAPPMSLVIEDADLIFDGDAPLVEPERTAISYIRSWAARPLVAADGRPHRIYMISANPTLRGALMTGRVAPIDVPLPNLDERAAFVSMLLSIHEDDDPIGWEDGLDLELFARQSGALNLLQIEDVVYQAASQDAIIRRAQVRDRKDELVKATYGGVLEISYPEEGFDSIVGYDDLKSYFSDWVAPKLRDGASDTPKGCLLSGPPGTGKTKFAQALAADLELPLVLVQMDRIKSKYVGESNKQMAMLIEGIRALSPAIVLFDEVDKVLGSTDDSSGVSQEIQGQLQTWMSEAPRGETFFIATTNYPKSVGGALVRPGRLEQILPLLPSHLDGRRTDVLELVASKMSIKTTLGQQMSVEHVERLEGAMADYTGADLEKLAMEASYEATLDDCDVVDYDHITQAASYVVPTIRAAGNQKMVDDAIETCSNQRFLPATDRPNQSTSAVRRLRTL